MLYGEFILEVVIVSTEDWINILVSRSVYCHPCNDTTFSSYKSCYLNLNRIDVSGTWHTGWNGAPVKMYLTQIGDLVTGSYEFNNGKLMGRITENILEGGWAQSNCVGNFKLIFTADGNKFNGHWGYNKEISGGGPWYGRKLHVEKMDATGFWESNYGSIYLEQIENTVVGKYDRNNGRLEGILEGNTLVGTWFENRYKFDGFDTLGSFKMTFNIDNTFSGARGINDSLISEGTWNGKKVINENKLLKPVETLDISGTWSTNFNILNLTQTGFNVSGEFDYRNGRLLGVIFGNIMTGTWYHDFNNDGEYERRGRFVFKFSEEGTLLSGTWGYSNSFSDGGHWSGEFKGK